MHLEVDGFDLANAKQKDAILRIEMLAEMQSVFLGDHDAVNDDDDDLGDVSFDDFVMD